MDAFSKDNFRNKALVANFAKFYHLLEESVKITGATGGLGAGFASTTAPH